MPNEIHHLHADMHNPRKKTIRGVSHDTIISLYVNDKLSTEEIASKVGCTRQRIGQVLRQNGINVVAQGRRTREERAKARAEENHKLFIKKKEDVVKEKARARAAADALKFRDWRLLWEQDKTIVEIALFDGGALEAVRAQIYRLRERYGWFPARRPRG